MKKLLAATAALAFLATAPAFAQMPPPPPSSAPLFNVSGNNNNGSYNCDNATCQGGGNIASFSGNNGANFDLSATGNVTNITTHRHRGGGD